MMKVLDIMTTDVRCLPSDATLFDARTMMMDHNIRHIPIQDGERLTGILSQRDVLKAESPDILNARPEAQKSAEQQIAVADICNTVVVTISPKASLLEAARYMQKHKLGCLPVVSGEKLVGIITDSDFVNIAVNLLEVAALDDIDPNY